MRNIARCATGHDRPESAVTIAGIRIWVNKQNKPIIERNFFMINAALRVIGVLFLTRSSLNLMTTFTALHLIYSE